jgi:hypothetical protein
MRERFFEIRRPDEALKFFREFGVWRFSRGSDDSASARFSGRWVLDCEGEPLSVTFSDLIYQRNFFDSALNLGPTEWQRVTIAGGNRRRAGEADGEPEFRALSETFYLLGGSQNGLNVNFTITPDTLHSPPIPGRVTVYEIQDALRATIILDWMEGREWLRCDAKGCARLFKRTSEHPVKYCSQRCASRARQERFRNQQPDRNEL